MTGTSRARDERERCRLTLTPGDAREERRAVSTRADKPKLVLLFPMSFIKVHPCATKQGKARQGKARPSLTHLPP